MPRRFLPFLCFLFMSQASAPAADLRFYVGGTAKDSHNQAIHLATLDPDTGALGPLVVAADTPAASFIALSADGRFLYACQEGGPGSVAAFRVRPDGHLVPLNARPSGGPSPCHVSLDPAGHHVLVANYSGSVAVFPVREDGSLGERTAFETFTGSGPDPKRQDAPHSHAIYPGPDGRHVYVCDLGTDRVNVFRLDPATGALSAAEPAFASTPPGAGPRHLAFSPDGRFAYVCNELALSVTAFSLDSATGALAPLETVSVVPPGDPAPGGSLVAEVACHPSGRFLYVSNRGHDRLAVFRVAGDGRLTLLEAVPAHVRQPRSFALDPAGRWLVAAGQSSHDLAVHAIDPETGKLTFTGHAAAAGMPVCVVFPPQ